MCSKVFNFHHFRKKLNRVKKFFLKITVSHSFQKFRILVLTILEPFQKNFLKYIWKFPNSSFFFFKFNFEEFSVSKNFLKTWKKKIFFQNFIKIRIRKKNKFYSIFQLLNLNFFNKVQISLPFSSIFFFSFRSLVLFPMIRLRFLSADKADYSASLFGFSAPFSARFVSFSLCVLSDSCTLSLTYPFH